jgi:pyruvate dehydrogenase E1 component
VVKAAQQLAAEGIACEVVSITSWSELARDGLHAQQRALRGEPHGTPYLHELLGGSTAPHRGRHRLRARGAGVDPRLPAAGRRYLTLGTDGFGRSDTRAALRDFFGVDASARNLARSMNRCITTSGSCQGAW